MKNPNLNKQINPNTIMPMGPTISTSFQNNSHDPMNNAPNVQSQSKLNELGKMIDLAMHYESAAQNKNNQVLSSLANASNILVEEIERKGEDILSIYSV
jgi:archaellum component FlaC